MNRISLSIIAIILAVATTVFVRRELPQQKPNPTLPEQTVSIGEVTVTAEPGTALQDGQTFSITLDTHTGSLDDDLVANALLTVAGGNPLRPLGWQGDPPGGHHREGVLRFPPVVERSGSIRLELALAQGQYVFTWDL